MAPFAPCAGSGGAAGGTGIAVHTADLTAGRLADTGIALPAGGWIRLVGTVAAGAYFAVSIPVALLSGLTAAAADDDLTNTAPFPTGHQTALVNFGHTSGGKLLMGSATAGAATLTAYRG